MSGERLPSDRLERYQGHLVLPGHGAEGQARLRAARVLLVGVGGLGCPAAQYLAASGVGRLTLVDPDRVELTNLQRQVLFGESDIGRPKVEAAADRLRAIDSEIDLRLVQQRLGAANARQLVAGHDLVVDGSDNFPTRYVVNDACVLEEVPLVSGSLYRYEGQVMVIRTPSTPCYRCIFPAPPADDRACREVGVLGPLAGVVGCLQAAEALRILVAGAGAMEGRLLLLDLRGGDVRTVALRADPSCARCGRSPSLGEPTAVAVAGSSHV